MPAENFGRERERMKKREAVETLSSDEGERKRGKQSLKNKRERWRREERGEEKKGEK